MKVVHKLLLAPVLVFGAILGVGQYVASTTEDALRAEIMDHSAQQCATVMNEIDRLVATRVEDWQAYASTPLVRRALRASNDAFAADDLREARIDEDDAQWRAAPPDETTPLMVELMENEVSRDLRARLETLERAAGFPVYGEVFLTNRYGANVAQTGRTSDYRQNDEDWWSTASTKGYYVGPLSYDESARSDSIDLCIRIEDENGNLMGVLKAVFDVREIFRLFDERVAAVASRGDRCLLLAGNRSILRACGRTRDLVSEESDWLHALAWPEVGQAQAFERTVPETGGRYLLSIARSGGHRRFPGLGWLVLIEEDAAAALLPATRMHGQVLRIALAAGLVAAVISGWLAYSLSRRFGALARAAQALGDGDRGARVPDLGADELGQLARSFNRMAEESARATADLERRHAELSREMQERKLAEAQRETLAAQLVAAQKLESIGRLAAGVAHEINTPTQYVGDNLRFLEASLADLLAVTGSVEQLVDAAESGALDAQSLAEARARLARADLGFLTAELPVATAQAIEGVDRIASIVRAMKEFSHPGTKDKVALDVNRAISSTVTVGRNEWKYVAEVETDFDPTLPVIQALPGELNQVLLNIIVNAAHAIAEKNEKGCPDAAAGLDGRIRIATRRAGESVEIRISDTGCGIPREIREKIFDPFFTTKGVGKGTGQGLAIAHDVVVNKHGGSIAIEDAPGGGTTFVLRLPIDAAAGALATA